MFVLEEEDRDLFHRVQERNPGRQYELLEDCIENGRTARAACYFLLCVRSGFLLPGKRTVPERIRENRKGYEAALLAADRAWDDGHLDFGVMESCLAGLLQAQLEDADV